MELTMKLVENWKSAWKWISIQIAALAAAIQAAILAFPSVKDYLSDTITHWVGLVLLLSLIVGRMIDQSKPQ